MDIQWDEDNNPKTPDCLLSFAREDAFHRGTAKALPWAAPADGDNTRRVVPVAMITSLLREMKVPDPDVLHELAALLNVLGLEKITEALEALVGGGLMTDEDDAAATREYRNGTELQRSSDKMVARLTNTMTELQVTREEDFESVDEADGLSPQFDWLAILSVADLVRRSRTLYAFAELDKIIGAKAVDTERGEAPQLNAMAADDGLLLAQVNSHFFGGKAPANNPQFLAARLGPFLIETKWPTVLNVETFLFSEYATNLGARASWKTADRETWLRIMVPIIEHVLGPDLPLLTKLMYSFKGEPEECVRQIERLGDILLVGQDSSKRVFKELATLETALRGTYQGLILASHVRLDPSTDTIEKIRGLADKPGPNRGAKDDGEGADERDKTSDDPGQDQVQRALASESHTELAANWVDRLGKNKLFPRLKLYKDVFKVSDVAPKAVLMKKAGQRLTCFTGRSHFLSKLADEADGLDLYFGQTLVYNKALKKVPEDMRNIKLDSVTTRQLCDLKWEEMDILNAIVLKVRSAEVATDFSKHSSARLYHDGALIIHVKTLMGRIFESIGYPTTVDEEEGVTFTDFMEMIEQMHTASVAMEETEAAAMFLLIDHFMKQGWIAAATLAFKVLYGASPADRSLTVWIQDDHSILAEMRAAVGGLADIRTTRKTLPGVFGKVPKARMLQGHQAEGKKGPGKREPEPNEERPRKKLPNKKGKEPVKETAAKVVKGKPGKDASKPADSPFGKRYTLTGMPKDERIELNPKSVYYYEDGTHSYMGWWTNWPGVCDLYGWNPKDYCAPMVMSISPDMDRREFCCMDATHADGCAIHKKWPKVNGKPFDPRDEAERLKDAGLVKKIAQLLNGREPVAPPGESKKKGGVTVYPSFA